MIYDSLTSNLVRLVRRRWYVFVAAAVLGALAAAQLNSTSNFVAEQTVLIGSLEDAGAILDAGVVPEVNVNRLASQASSDFDQSDLSTSVNASFAADLTARTIKITATAGSEDDANAALLTLNARFVEIVTQPLIAQFDTAIATSDDTLGTLRQTLQDATDDLADAGGDPTTVALLVAAQSDARDEIARAQERKGVLEALRSYVADGLVVSGSSSTTSPTTGVRAYAAGAMLGLVLATLAAVAWVLADRRVRRAVHLQRAAPFTPVLGFVARSDGPPELDDALVAGVRHFVAQHHVEHVVVLGVGRRARAQPLGTALAEAVNIPVETSELPSAQTISDRSDDLRVGYIGVVQWGTTTEDQVSTAVGDAQRAGDVPMALILDGIPRRERDWVAAAGHEPAGV
ncbi:hypothetical protein BH24ACT5_BH24ACT5_20280 [soil metagenome]